MAEKVTIHVKSDVIFDEKLDILITGVAKSSKITVALDLTQNKVQFGAHGHYIADSHGRIRLNEEPSIGGTYYGLEAMGLFWSLQPLAGQRRGIFYNHKDKTKPEILKLTVHEGHLTRQELVKSSPLAAAGIRRHFMADDVERITIRQGRILGILYKPKGRGPYPGILYVQAFTTRIWDYMACHLASYGFAVLHLLYSYHEHLPNLLSDVEMEYFLEAVDWFSNESYVNQGGIQTIGSSVGGSMALILSSLRPEKITAVVDICGPTFMVEPFVKYQEKNLPSISPEVPPMIQTDYGVYFDRIVVHDLSTAPEDTWMKVENITGKVLFVLGEDDHGFDTTTGVEYSIKRMQAAGKRNYEILRYPGTGHQINIPFFPVITETAWGCSGEIKALTKSIVNWGGKTHAHAKAQEDSWKKILAFLRSNVDDRTSTSRIRASINHANMTKAKL